MAYRIVGVLALLFLASCSHWPWSASTADYGWYRLQLPDAANEATQWQGQWQFLQQETRLDLTLVQSGSEQRIAALLFGAIGGTLFSAQWDGQTVQETRSELIPEGVRADSLLAELQLAFWSMIEIRKGILDPNVSIEQQGLVRTVYHQSEPMISIKYSHPVPAFSDVVLIQHQAGYQWSLRRGEDEP